MRLLHCCMVLWQGITRVRTVKGPTMRSLAEDMIIAAWHDKGKRCPKF